MSQDAPIRVAIVDDHSIVRRGLSAILITNDQLKLVWEAEDGQEAVELCEPAQPDVVLMDLIMPRMDEIGARSCSSHRSKEQTTVTLLGGSACSLVISLQTLRI